MRISPDFIRSYSNFINPLAKPLFTNLDKPLSGSIPSKFFKNNETNNFSIHSFGKPRVDYGTNTANHMFIQISNKNNAIALLNCLNIFISDRSGRTLLKSKTNTQHRTAQIHVLHNKVVIHLIAQVTVAQLDIAPAEAIADGSEQLIAQF